MVRIKQLILTLTVGLIAASDLVAGLSHAADIGPVTVRSWQHSDFGRLVIEWADRIKVQQKRTGDRLTLRFARPFPADAGPAVTRLENYLDADRTAVDGADLLLALKSGVSAKLKIYEQKIVVIDFSRALKGENHRKVGISKIENGVRLTFDWPQPMQFETRQQSDNLRVTFTPNGKVDQTDLARLNNHLQPWFSDLRQSIDDDTTTLTFDLRPMIGAEVRAEGDHRTTIDLTHDASKKLITRPGDTKDFFIPASRPQPPISLSEQRAGDLPPKPRRRPDFLEKPASGKSGNAFSPVSHPSPTKVDDIVFDWEGQFGAAVFLRAGYLWAVFDAPLESSRSSLPPPAPAWLNAGELVPAEGGTAFRFRQRKPVGIDVTRDEDGRWHVKPAADPVIPNPVTINRIGGPPRLRATASSHGQIVRFVDPAVGDEINVLPLRDVRLGQSGRRRFVDLELLPTAQGLAWRSLSDHIVARIREDGLEFSSPNGLSLSTLSEPDPNKPESVPDGERQPVFLSEHVPDSDTTSIARAAGEPKLSDHEALPATVERSLVDQTSMFPEHQAELAVPSSFFDFAGSGVDRALVSEMRRILRQGIGKAPPEARDHARLDLAKLLVAERLAAEARTVLGAISEDADDHIAASRRALHGASAFLIGHMAEASSLLQAAEFDEDEEIGIWRAAIMSANKNWDSAAALWQQAEKALDIYPPRLRIDLGLMAIEAAIQTGDDALAREGFQRLKSLQLSPYDTARVQRMQALDAERNGDIEQARTILQELAEGRYHDISIAADFQLAALTSDDRSNDRELLAALDSRLPLWRGHPQEIDMLDALARRYREANELRKALTLWQRLVKLDPEAGRNPNIENTRRETFVQALANSKSPQIELLDVYSIYLDFIDLLPDEAEARHVHRDLARHLADLDLLDEAVEVLQPLVESGADKVEAADIGAEMAELLLRRGRAESALSALERTAGQSTALPVALDQKRRLARARALAKLDRDDDALRAIQELQTPAVRRLRAEIFWKQRNWPRLTTVIESILEDPNLPMPFAVEDQKLVLWLALAREQQGRPEQLRKLRHRYASDMQTGPWGDAFNVATQTVDGTDDLKSFLAHAESRLAELRRFRESSNETP